MSTFITLIISSLIIWGCWRFMRKHVLIGPEYDAEIYSMRRSEPTDQTQGEEHAESAHRLPAHLLKGCPPDPCPEVLYEHLRPADAVTYAELKRPKTDFQANCCGSPRILHHDTWICSECDELGYAEDEEEQEQ